MTLDQLKPGESAVITSVTNVTAPVAKILTMGIIEESVVECKTTLSGVMELNVYGALLALSKDTAKHFTCERIAGVSKAD